MAMIQQMKFRAVTIGLEGPEWCETMKSVMVEWPRKTPHPIVGDKITLVGLSPYRGKIEGEIYSVTEMYIARGENGYKEVLYIAFDGGRNV